MDNDDSKRLRRIESLVNGLRRRLLEYDEDSGKPSIMGRIDSLERQIRWGIVSLAIEGGIIVLLLGYVISISMR